MSHSSEGWKVSDKVFSRDWFLFLTKMAASLLCLHRGERKGGGSHSSPLTQVLRLGIALMTSLKLNSIITGPNEAEDELTLALVYTLYGNPQSLVVHLCVLT